MTKNKTYHEIAYLNEATLEVLGIYNGFRISSDIEDHNKDVEVGQKFHVRVKEYKDPFYLYSINAVNASFGLSNEEFYATFPEVNYGPY